MPGAEQKPGIPTPQPLELHSEPIVLTDGKRSVHLHKREKDGALFVQIKGEETVIFTAAVVFNPKTHQEEVRLGFALPTTNEPTLAALEPTATQDSQQETTVQEQKEKEEPVTLRGRIATEIRRLPSPTGGEMARFQFAEHPNRSVWSYWHVEPENERPALKGNTVYRSIGAFDDHVELLAGAEKGQEYDLTCFKRSWKEPGTNGNQKTVKGFYLLGIQKVTKRARPQQEQKE